MQAPSMPHHTREGRPLRGQLRLALGVPKNHSIREEYRRCGAPTCTTCRDGPGHGPYRYAVWREGAKVKRKYLGKACAGTTVNRTGRGKERDAL